MAAPPNKLGLSFSPENEPTVPRRAATVIVLREAHARLETFCMVRSARSGFLGGAVVFPGGKVDLADDDPGWQARVRGAPVRALELADSDHEARALAVAAARETLEEIGVFPAAIDSTAAEALRQASAKDLQRRVTELGIFVELDRLVSFARWVTPEAEPRRFDARFFLLAMPSGQAARADEHEATSGFWASPHEVLERFMRGDIMLAPPTTRCLELLADARSIDEAFALARNQTLLAICPQFVPGDPPALALPGDPEHPLAERRVVGPTRFVLRDGKFVSEDAPPEISGLRRSTTG